eukprot:COSAG01_NODE_541_length_15735_cov_4.534088_5_plen_67_part_00
MRVGQVTRAMRVRAGVAPRVALGDPAGAKGKSACGASFGLYGDSPYQNRGPKHTLPQLVYCRRTYY